MGAFITYADLTGASPSFPQTIDIIDHIFLRRNQNPTPHDWNNSHGFPHTTDSLVDLGNCLGAACQYISQDLGGNPSNLAQFISRGAYKSAFGFPGASNEALYASTGTTYQSTWWNGNPGNFPTDYTIADVEFVFGLTAGSLQDAINGQNFVPTGGQASPPPTPPSYNETGYEKNVDEPWGNRGVLEPSSVENLAAQGGVTSYNIVEGEFALAQFPTPDRQYVKRTIQGIADSFEYESEDIGLINAVGENDEVSVSEFVYSGEALQVINSTETADPGTVPTLANDPYSGPNFLTNRIICEFSEGKHSGLGRTLSSSTCDDIVAIAVKDVRPFLLKSLNYEGYKAEMEIVDKSVNHEIVFPNDLQFKSKPTNDIYIQHLTPSKESRVAVIPRPDYAKQFENFPPLIEVHYNAIDLTGETVASIKSGNSINDINDFAKGKIVDVLVENPYLVVTKTVPSGSTLFPVLLPSGLGSEYRSLSDILRRPYDIYNPPSLAVQERDTKLTVFAPGGLISIPAKKLNKPLKDGVLRSNPTGGINPSPFIDISECMVSTHATYKGYGRPKAIPSTEVPDLDTEEDYHFLTVSTGPATDGLKEPKKNKTDSIISQTTNLTFDIIDNQVSKLNQWLLIHPKNKKRFNALDDFVTGDKGNPSIVTIEYNLMRGRVEELEPGTSTTKDAGITIRGRSMLMDLADQVADRDFSLIDGSPIKEIGDMGTPTVSMTLAGPGQGAIDVKPDYMQHASSPGWKDRIISSGNASVRNDKQTSTYYASTRALVELPLFPSMFFDVDKIFTDEKNAPLPSDKAFEMIVDCTMTAQNRASMKLTESRFGIDWGLESDIAAFTITDQIYKLSQYSGENSGTLESKGIDTRPVLRCQKPEMTAVITSINTTTGVITVDDATAFSGFAMGYITIGEGAILDVPLGYVGQFTLAGNTFTPTALTKIFSMKKEDRISETDSRSGVDLAKILVGMTVMAGGYVVQTPDATSSGWDLELPTASTVDKGSIAASLKAALDKVLGGVGAAGLLYPYDQSGATYYYAQGKGPDMEAFDYDVDEVLEAYNDRNIVQGVDCKSNFVSLKGKSSDGNSLLYVLPQRLNFSEIVSESRLDFDGCVNELIRRINAAGHPNSLNANRGSAFDPVDVASGATAIGDTGSHMGYVRAFIGERVESVDGESGVSIVIHSTVPGASGRNFAVWLTNNSPYSYRPQQAFGFGGLLTNNSRHYQSSSFPAPLPLGFDGETYVPITTFTGPLHGELLKQKDGVERHYNGIGGSIKCKLVKPVEKEDWNETAVADDVLTNVGVIPRITASTNAVALYSTSSPVTFSAFRQSGNYSADFVAPITSLAVDFESVEAGLRIAGQVSAQNKGVLRIGGRLAYFEGISALNPLLHTRAENAMWIEQITPFDEIGKFYERLFVDDNGVTVDNYGIEIEILYPSIDSKGILFFGGGHTGVTLDISDGTNNDYSDRYKHHLSTGPTGFSGFQNIAEVSKASAVLDFTNLRNEDTYHGFTYVGKHHATDRSVDSEPKDDCIMYISMCEPNNLPAGLIANFYYQDNTHMEFQDGTKKITYPQNDKSILKEEIYGNGLNYSSPHGNSEFYESGVIADWVDTPISLEPYTAASPYTKTGYSYIAAHDYDGSAPAGEKILPLVKGYGSASLPVYAEDQGAISFGATSDYLSATNYSVSFWVKRTKPLLFATKGPIIHGIDNNGQPWGISLAGVANTNSAHQWNVCMHMNDGATVQPRYVAIDLQAYSIDHGGNYPSMNINVWYHFVMSYNATAGPQLFFGQKGSALENLSPYLVNNLDGLYQPSSGFSNSVDGAVTNSYPYASNPGTPSFDGVADHPFVFLGNGPPSVVNSSFALRDKKMVTIAQALHGPPRHPLGFYWDQQPATPSMQSGTPDTVPETDNHNTNGPIFFTNGSLAHIGVWNRRLSEDEAQGLHSAATQW
jgi:hypothetical protein